MLTPAVEMSRRNGDKLLILLALRIFDTASQVTENTPDDTFLIIAGWVNRSPQANLRPTLNCEVRISRRISAGWARLILSAVEN